MSTAASPLETLAPPLPPEARLSVYRVSPQVQVLSLLWPQVEPILARAVAREHGRFTTRDLFNWIARGEHDLWVATENGRVVAAIVAILQRYASGKRGWTVHLAAGSRARDWVPLLISAAIPSARLRGATEIRVCGRKGWLRYLKPHGFAVESQILTRQEVF